MRHSEFAQNLCLLALDELHLVSEWREFRPEYYDLGVLRARLPDGIPFLGASATLDFKTLNEVKERCEFDSNTSIIKTGLDRPEIYLQLSTLKYPIKGMLDLQFLLPSNAVNYLDIPKTIIFMDSIASIKNACALIKSWMKQLNYPSVSSRWISPFFSDMATKDKEKIAASFESLSESCMGPRILIATDAYGLGIDNLDVKRVVQWLVPKSMARLYQRMGRAMRCGKEQAHFILLHPGWCVGPKSETILTEIEETDEPIAESNLKDSERRAKLSPGLWNLMNASDNDCIREIGLTFFDDDKHKLSNYQSPIPCCSLCHPDFQTPIEPHEELNQTTERNASKSHWYTLKLREWREAKARTMFDNSQYQFFPSLIMPDEVLDSLATWAENISDETTMRRWVGNEWADIQDHWLELLEILKRGQAMDLDQGEMFEIWVRHNDVKRGRVTVPTENLAKIEFESRREEWMLSHGHKVNTAKKNSRGNKGKNRHDSTIKEKRTKNTNPVISEMTSNITVAQPSSSGDNPNEDHQ